MSAGVVFWRLPDEEQDFLTYLEKEPSVRAIVTSAAWPGPTRDLLATPSELVAREGPELCCLLLHHHFELLRINSYESKTGRRWEIDTTNSPVVVYQRGKLTDGTRLELSSLYAYLQALADGNTKLVRKDKEFVSWANKVFAWTRKRTPVAHSTKTYRVSQRAAEAQANGVLLVE